MAFQEASNPVEVKVLSGWHYILALSPRIRGTMIGNLGIFCILFLLAHPLLSAESLMKGEKQSNAVQYINENGWHIPGMEHIQLAKLQYQAITIRDGFPIQFTRMMPARELEGQRLFYSIIFPLGDVSGGNIVYREKDGVVREIMSYSVNGKAFCYVVAMASYFREGVAGDGY